jgi:hypothetical protein
MLDLEKVKKRLVDKLELDKKMTLQQVLYEAYVIKKLSLYELEKITFGEASHMSLNRLIRSYGIKLRGRGGKHDRKPITEDA